MNNLIWLEPCLYSYLGQHVTEKKTVIDKFHSFSFFSSDRNSHKQKSGESQTYVLRPASWLSTLPSAGPTEPQWGQAPPGHSLPGLARPRFSWASRASPETTSPWTSYALSAGRRARFAQPLKGSLTTNLDTRVSALPGHVGQIPWLSHLDPMLNLQPIFQRPQEGLATESHPGEMLTGCNVGMEVLLDPPWRWGDQGAEELAQPGSTKVSELLHTLPVGFGVFLFLRVTKYHAQLQDTGLIFYYEAKEQHLTESYLMTSLKLALSMTMELITHIGSWLPALHSKWEISYICVI